VSSCTICIGKRNMLLVVVGRRRKKMRTRRRRRVTLWEKSTRVGGWNRFTVVMKKCQTKTFFVPSQRKKKKRKENKENSSYDRTAIPKLTSKHQGQPGSKGNWNHVWKLNQNIGASTCCKIFCEVNELSRTFEAKGRQLLGACNSRQSPRGRMLLPDWGPSRAIRSDSKGVDLEKRRRTRG
jgi:hypothetical protein